MVATSPIDEARSRLLAEGLDAHQLDKQIEVNGDEPYVVERLERARAIQEQERWFHEAWGVSP